VWLGQYLWTQWGLATQGNDAPVRLALIVRTLQNLKGTDRINPDMVQLLNLATNKLATSTKS